MAFLVHHPTGLVFGFEEEVEKIIPVFGRDSDTVVSDPDEDSQLVRRVSHHELVNRNFNHIVTLRKLNRVFDQVDQDLLSPHVINKNILVHSVLDP